MTVFSNVVKRLKIQHVNMHPKLQTFSEIFSHVCAPLGSSFIQEACEYSARTTEPSDDSLFTFIWLGPQCIKVTTDAQVTLARVNWDHGTRQDSGMKT